MWGIKLKGAEKPLWTEQEPKLSKTGFLEFESNSKSGKKMKHKVNPTEVVDMFDAGELDNEPEAI